MTKNTTLNCLTVVALLTVACAEVAWSTSNGTCVINPNAHAPVESLGKGVIQKAETVCDAAVHGCGACLEACQLFSRIQDNFGCPLDGEDGFCNPDVQDTDPDCGADGRCLTSVFTRAAI